MAARAPEPGGLRLAGLLVCGVLLAGLLLAGLGACASAGAEAAPPLPVATAAPASPSDPLEYDVTLAPGLPWRAEVRLRLHLRSPGPVWLTDGEPERPVRLPDQLLVRQGAGAGAPVARDERGRYRLPALTPGGAEVRYRVALKPLAGGDLLVSPQAFLLRPERARPEAWVTVRFHLPAGLSVSAPWPPAGAGPSRSFRLTFADFRRGAHLAFGRLRALPLEVDGVRLDLWLFAGERRATRAGLAAWLRTTWRAVARFYGRPPASRVHVVVSWVPSADPAVFGHVFQTRMPSLWLLCGREAGDGDFGRDWVAVHEMFHLGQPQLGHDLNWFTEGFATYYQDVIRARAGLMTPRGMWEDLVWGFHRGHRAFLRGESLLAASRSMRSYPRVYWGGALVALLYDLAIRQRTGGRRSLDDAMRALQRRAARGEDLGLNDLLAAIDRAAGGAPFARALYERHVARAERPDLAALYARLGVVAEGSELVRLVPSAPLATLRDAIARPPAGR